MDIMLLGITIIEHICGAFEFLHPKFILFTSWADIDRPALLFLGLLPYLLQARDDRWKMKNDPVWDCPRPLYHSLSNHFHRLSLTCLIPLWTQVCQFQKSLSISEILNNYLGKKFQIKGVYLSQWHSFSNMYTSWWKTFFVEKNKIGLSC